MAEDPPTAIHDLVRRTFATLQAKDLETLMQMFADDAVVIDPHFPTPRMQGKASIRKGFGEAMSGMRSFGYTIANYFEYQGGPADRTPIPLDQMPGSQTRVVAAMIEAALSETPPRRLLLGSDAYGLVTAALNQRLATFERQKAVAFSTDIDQGEVAS